MSKQANPVTTSHPDLLTNAMLEALAMPGGGRSLVVGICDGARELVCGGRLASFEQIGALERRLRPLGYEPVVAGDADDMRRCDVLFVPAREAGAVAA